MTGSVWCALGWLAWRETVLAWRRRSDLLGALFFFAMVVTLVPLAVGPDTTLLRTIAPGIVWVAALLAAMLSLGRLFADDYADGTLEQLLLTPYSLPLLVATKVTAQWLVSTAPLLVVTPMVAVQFGLTRSEPLTLTLSLLFGVPVVLLVGSIGAALTLGARGAGALTPLLVLPLCIPALIFGAGAVPAASAGSASGNLRILAALLILAVTLAPWATAAALRISVE
jgi:heme exporter protein B